MSNEFGGMSLCICMKFPYVWKLSRPSDHKINHRDQLSGLLKSFQYCKITLWLSGNDAYLCKRLIWPAPNGVPISSYHATIKMSDKEIRIVWVHVCLWVQPTSPRCIFDMNIIQDIILLFGSHMLQTCWSLLANKSK